MLQTIYSGFYTIVYSWGGGGQHDHVKLFVYFKLDYKFGYEFRRVLFLLHYFASVMVLLCI